MLLRKLRFDFLVLFAVYLPDGNCAKDELIPKKVVIRLYHALSIPLLFESAP